MEKKRKRDNLLENLFVVALVFYPLRHINWGLDFWDTGYNYVNFQYMGSRHVDPMWIFSTYLANVVGNLLMKLPSAGNLMGMNFYTGLTVSLLAVMGYFFCSRKLKMPGWIAFIGEMIAVSLCWCPTSLLYNYLTYVFFLACVILLYQGLTEGKTICLVLAGVCLGTNILVRFSNLPEASLILAVWAYDVIVWRKRGKDRAAGPGESLWRTLGQHTFWCFVGYGSSLLVLFSYIHARHGFGNYVAGIRRLFAMTENARDYTPVSMLLGVMYDYVMNLYWVIRIGVILAAGIALFAAVDRLLRKYGSMEKMVWWWCGRLLLAFSGAAALVWLYGKGFLASDMVANSHINVETLPRPMVLFFPAAAVGVALFALVGWPLQKRCGMEKAFWWEGRFLWTAVSAAMLAWLYLKGFCKVEFLWTGPISYGSMLRPGVLFLILTLLICMLRFLDKDCAEQEKLISAMIILVIPLTSIGSNNASYPSLNNLFAAAPYTLWQCWRFCRNVKEGQIRGITFSMFPVKGLLVAFIGMCLFQFGGFGAKFVYAESTGVYNLTSSVGNNEILKNIKMSPERAKWMTELSDYVEGNELQGREVILYGYVPSLSYYLQMPPAFNSWSDLRSYSYDTMVAAMEAVEERMRDGGTEKPIVLVDYLRKGLEEDKKWGLIQSFMERNGYQLDWQNDRFAVYK